MTGTVGYQAGTESNDVVISYIQEATYGALPALNFQAIRTTGESLAGSKTRNRPGEILPTGEVSSAVTVQEMAAGSVNFALSFDTYHDMLAGALSNDWSVPTVFNETAANISCTSGNPTAGVTIGAPAGTFSNLLIPCWIRISGFVQPAMNGIFRVSARSADGSSILITPFAAVTAEAPAGNAVQIRGQSLVNARLFKSFYIQKKLAPALYLRYPGSYFSAFTLSGGVGQFLSGSFTVMAQQELSATTDASAGVIVAAPAGRVHDPVGGFGGVFLDGSPVPAVVDSFTIDVTATGAKQEFGMGSSASAGQLMGLLECKGTLKVYFKDFTLYTRFKSETQGMVSFVTRDSAGNAYVLSLFVANLVNPKINAGGPNQPVMASFDLEGNPRAGGGTIQIDRLTAA